MARATAEAQLRSWGADTAIILGSGLNSLVGEAAPDRTVSYQAFDEIPRPSVAGHAGQFVLGSIGKSKVIFAQGRVHLYEGHSAAAVTAGIRLLANCGISRVILTNAAGTANAAFAPGSWMMISDHLNLTGTTPLLGSPTFIDMSDVYTAEWRAEFTRAAQKEGVTLHEGVYAGLLGPQYETPAEVRMLRHFGADAVGMSTVLEAIQARALGMRITGFSCLTNWAAGIGHEPLDHAEVLTTGRKAAAEFERLLAAAL